MTEYTPSEQEVRDAHVRGAGGTAGNVERRERFDRWLALVKADAWDECGRILMGEGYEDSETWLRNPYRGEQA